MFNALLRTIAIRTTQKKNAFIFGLKSLPLIGKKLPDSLYSIQAFQVIGYIIGGFLELTNVFIGKIFYIALAVLAPMLMFLGLNSDPETPELLRNIAVDGNLFYQILFVTTLGAAFLGDDIFDYTQEKETSISMFNMDAKQVLVSDAVYKFVKLAVSYLIFIPITAYAMKVPVAGAFIFALFSVALKLVRSAIAVWHVRKKGSQARVIFNPKINIWILLLIFAVAYVLPVFNLSIPYLVVYALMAVITVAAIPAFLYIRTVTPAEYKVIFSNELANSAIKLSKTESAAEMTSKKMISEDKDISSNKKGFEYLNDLFVKRHKKMLWSSTLKISGILLVLILAFAVLILKLRSEGAYDTIEEIKTALQTKLHYSLFVFYLFLNKGATIAQTMFVNCDSSLLTYSFYKKPSSILSLFLIRAKTMIKINSLPALVLGLGLSGVEVLAGVTDPLIHIYSFVTILAISAFFSIHYLAVYYLLQPFNVHSEMKSGKYVLANSVIYMICLGLFQVPSIPVKLFAPIALGVLVLYMVIASVLVYKFSPKTFKIHN